MTATTNVTTMRWVKFSSVGLIGIAVQIGAFTLLTSALRTNYLLATAVSVEAAVLHNFLWHERFTWADRRSRTRAIAVFRLLRFNLSNGLVSIAGNLVLMHLFAGTVHLPYLQSCLFSIACCALLNFLASDRLVFY